MLCLIFSAKTLSQKPKKKYHTILATKKNLYIWGGNCNIGRSNYLTNGSLVDSVDPEYVKLDSNETFAAVGASSNNTFYLTSSGKVYCFKSLEEQSDDSKLYELEPADEPRVYQKFVAMSVTNEHLLLVSEQKRLFVAGIKNEYGQMGLTQSFQHYGTYKLIETLKNVPIILIETGIYSSFALSENNDLYVWGKNTGFFFFSDLLLKFFLNLSNFPNLCFFSRMSIGTN